MSDIKRPTAYLVLEELVARGLVVKSRGKKATLFRALSPQHLIKLHQDKTKAVEDVLPQLQAIFKESGDRPTIQIFEEVPAVKDVYREINNFLKTGEEVLWVGTFEYVAKEFFEEIDEWKELIAKYPNAKSRDLISDGRAEKEFYEKTKRISKNYRFRFVASDVGKIKNDIVIFGSKVAIISAEKHISATVIDSAWAAETFRTVYNLAWKAARKPKG